MNMEERPESGGAEPQAGAAGNLAPEAFFRKVAIRTWDAFVQDALLHVLAALLVLVGSALTVGILSGPLIVGYIGTIRKRLRGEPAELTNVLDGLKRFLVSFLTALIIAVAVAVGSFLLVVPGVLAALFCMFALHRVAYEDASVAEALADSFGLVKDHFLNALLLYVSLAILSLAGAAIVVGFLLTLPLTFIALTVAYEEFTGARSGG